MNIEHELKRLSVRGILNKQHTDWIRLDVAIRKCKQALSQKRDKEKVD